MSDETPAHEGMSLVVKTVSHWVKLFALLFGIYVVLYGHLTPGGGFPGGVVMACAFILVMLAEGRRAAVSTLSFRAAARFESSGALIFFAMGLLGMLFGTVFFKNIIDTPPGARYHLLSGGIIPLCNIGVGIKVTCSLFLVFAVLSIQHIMIRNREKRDDEA